PACPRSFPTRRSSDLHKCCRARGCPLLRLGRHHGERLVDPAGAGLGGLGLLDGADVFLAVGESQLVEGGAQAGLLEGGRKVLWKDRKSTRLNSSHVKS